MVIDKYIDSNGIMDDEVRQMSYAIRRRFGRKLKLLSLLHCPVTETSVAILSNYKVKRRVENIKLDNDFGVSYTWSPWIQFKSTLASICCSNNSNLNGRQRLSSHTLQKADGGPTYKSVSLASPAAIDTESIKQLNFIKPAIKRQLSAQ